MTIVRVTECTTENLASTWQETGCSFDVYHATKGVHIETY